MADCCIWGSGLVLLTLSNALFWVEDFAEPQTQPLPDPNLYEPPTCMTVIEPALTEGKVPEVLLGNVDGSIVIGEPECAGLS